MRATGRPQAGIFGLVHDAHAAAAQLLDDAVVRERLADQWIAAGLTVAVAMANRDLACGQIDRRAGEKAVRVVVRGEQRAKLAFQLPVGAAGAAQKRLALRGGRSSADCSSLST